MNDLPLKHEVCTRRWNGCACPACRQDETYRKQKERARRRGQPEPPYRATEEGPRIPYVSATWEDRAACQGLDPDIFFKDVRAHDRANILAKQICRSCEAQDDCLTHALKRKEKYGIWGGLTTRQRQQLGNQTIPIDIKLGRAHEIREQDLKMRTKK